MCGVSECDGEASTVRKPRPTRGCRGMGKNVELLSQYRLNYFVLLQVKSVLF